MSDFFDVNMYLITSGAMFMLSILCYILFVGKIEKKTFPQSNLTGKPEDELKSDSQILAEHIGNNYPILYANILSQSEKQGLNLNNYGSSVANVQSVVNLAVYAMD